MVEIKVKFEEESKSFDVTSDLTGAENRIIFAELVTGVTAAVKDLAVKMGIPKDMLLESFCGALTEGVLKE